MHFSLSSFKHENLFLPTRNTWLQEFNDSENMKDHRSTTLKSSQDYQKWTSILSQQIGKQRQKLRLNQPIRNLILGKNYRLLWTLVPPITIPSPHRRESPTLHYHNTMVIYTYPFLVVIHQFFFWIIFITYCICILNGSPE